MSSGAPSRAQIFAVSDGTGETCASAVRAVMLQFQAPWRMRTFPAVRSPADARRVVDEAEDAGALIVFSLVDEAVAGTLREEASRRGVDHVDLLGPLISQVTRRVDMAPRSLPGLLHGMSDDYFRRVEAVEFAVSHDDGANTRTLFEADLVLTGVSRTSKTPLSMYLAQRGYKTGNVPLVPMMEPPRQLLEIDPGKVFALDVDRATLLEVRRARVRSLGRTPDTRYADADAILMELDQARRLFRQRGWSIINVSGRAVEENAARILELYETRHPRSRE